MAYIIQLYILRLLYKYTYKNFEYLFNIKDDLNLLFLNWSQYYLVLVTI